MAKKTRRTLRRPASGDRAAGRKLLRKNLSALERRDPRAAQLASAPPHAERIKGEQESVAEEWAAANLRGSSLLVILGLGSGARLRHAVTTQDVILRKILVVEPDVDVLRAAVRQVDLTRPFSDPRVTLLVGLDPVSLAKALYEVFSDVHHLRLSRAMGILRLPHPNRTYAAALDAAERAVSDASAQALASYGNAPQDALRGLENLLRNLPVLARSPDLGKLVGQFRRRPAVIASAGPSLAKQFDALREIQGKVLLLCPDTSLGPLVAAGIRPHIVCSRERLPRTSSHLAGQGDEGIWLAGNAALHPRCFEVFEGPAVAVFSDAAPHHWLPGKHHLLEYRGSAANMGFRLAQQMGCDPILMVGQDLALGDDGSTHVQGTRHGQQNKRMAKRPRMSVPGNLGRPVMSNALLVGFRQVFELDIASRPGTYLNCTEAGALIRGAPPTLFREAIRRHLSDSPEFDARSRLTELLAPPGPELEQRQAAALAARLEEARTKLAESLEVCRTGLALARTAAGSDVPAEFGELPADVEISLQRSPLRKLDQLRNAVADDPVVSGLITPTSVAFGMRWAVEMFSRQRGASDGADLYPSIVQAFLEWFQQHEMYLRVTVELIGWGADALLRAYPESDVTATPLPSMETETYIWAERVGEAIGLEPIALDAGMRLDGDGT